MTESSILDRSAGRPPTDWLEPASDRRPGAERAPIPDLHHFFDRGRPFGERDAPARSLALAGSLFEAIVEGLDKSGEGVPPSAGPGLRERIITDALLRSEAAGDQNVYLGDLFTRRLTQAVPDLIFQPASVAEAARAFRWARQQGVPVTLRGAGSTAMGGSVPNDAGLSLDLSRLDEIEIDPSAMACAVGAGARLRDVHRKLADSGLALRAYPSNLGGTLAGWFVTGGIGLNAFGNGRALDSVLAADVLLPSGYHVRFHRDGRLDVPQGELRRTLTEKESARWFRARDYEPMTLADLAGSEGAFGAVLQLTVAIEPRPEIAALLLSFERESDALEAADWTARHSGDRFAPPANLKLFSGSHLHHTRRVWREEDERAWRRQPGEISRGDGMPWTRILGPPELGVPGAPDRERHAAYLFVDFLDPAAASAFLSALGDCPGDPRVLGEESARFAAERFRPQQTKRLGPGLLAAEIVMPFREVRRFLPRARRLARNVGADLDAEVYYLADDEALVIAAFLTDHRSAAYGVDLMLGPALLDLAMSDHSGRPYVLGRWQSAYLERKFGRGSALRIRSVKLGLDPPALVNRGVLLGPRFRGALGTVLGAGFAPMVTGLRFLYGAPPLAWLARLARAALRPFAGPARGRGSPAVVSSAESSDGSAPPASLAPEDRALHCVNCGECNVVCPIFNESKIRLPQMLTHLGEAARGGDPISPSGSVLLDLCMRCGNCEEACQAGIPHLPLYESMQKLSDSIRPRDPDRHADIVAAVRESSRYLREFLHVRPGGYLKRSPASLPGVARYLVLRAENDAGPAATCIHCGACVAVCPTHANREFEGADPRSITTVEDRCIGCGTCVEICPANLSNGGQTLRVMEAPTLDWFAALDEFERRGRP